MTTNVDICNRALLMLGSKNTIVVMTQDSEEAKVLNQIYTTVTDWCHSMANWNFARTTALLTQLKTVTVPPPANWGTTQPSPPWTHEYSLPADFINAIYLTNSDNDAANTIFLGEPKRFAIARDASNNAVLLTNETSSVLIYTGRIVDPTQWPGYFERFAVAALAWSAAATLTQNPNIVSYMDEVWVRFFQIAEQINREQGLVFGDTTPEWIQAVGIPYPNRRIIQSSPRQAGLSTPQTPPDKGPTRDNRR